MGQEPSQTLVRPHTEPGSARHTYAKHHQFDFDVIGESPSKNIHRIGVVDFFKKVVGIPRRVRLTDEREPEGQSDDATRNNY